ncbi:MAG: CBS domain-containing protein [Dehalococcoidia bacterium]
MTPIRIKDVFALHGTTSVSVSEDTSLEDVIARLATDPSVRGISLVDSSQRFVGMITPTDLLKWAGFRLGSWFPVPDRLSAADVVGTVFATRAKDLARGDWHTLGVRPDDTLERALKQMIDHEVDTIPVLDAEGQILGDLTVSEVLFKTLEVGNKLRPQRDPPSP